MEVELKILYLPAREEVQHAYACHDKIRKVFALPPSTILEEGLSGMAKWVKAEGCRTSKTFEHIEIMRNIPLAWLQK